MGSRVHVHKYLKFTFIKPNLKRSFPCPGPRGERGQWAAECEKVFISGGGSRLVEDGVVGLAFGNIEGIWGPTPVFRKQTQIFSAPPTAPVSLSLNCA